MQSLFTGLSGGRVCLDIVIDLKHANFMNHIDAILNIKERVRKMSSVWNGFV